MRIRVCGAGVLGVGLVLGSLVARSDMGPEEELFGDAITASVSIGGIGQFPGHVFYLFPLRCSRALVSLEEGGEELGVDDVKVIDGVDDQPNFAVLQDGPIDSWVGGGDPCQISSVYAMDRDMAAGIDLASKTLAEQQAFFADDPRLFRTDFKFVDNPPYAGTGSPLRSVHEELRVLRVDAEALVIVLDEATYRFVDGTEQTLKLAHTRRPELPFRPLKPEKIAKYASSFGKWETRHSGAPPPAPRLPAGAEERLAELAAEQAAEAAAETGTETGAGTGAGTGTGTVVAGTGAGTGTEVAAPEVAAPVVAAPVVATPVVATPVVAVPVVEQAGPVAVEAVVEEADELEAPSGLQLRRAWPLAIALVVGVGAAIALRRRPGR